MDDVVQRLRAGLDAGAIDLADIMDAAAEIERLRRIVSMWEQCATMTRDMYGGCYRPAYVEKLEQTAKALVAAAQPINDARLAALEQLSAWIRNWNLNMG